jgi:hypothetical protein
MDVDSIVPVQPSPEAVEKLGELLTQLESTPSNVRLLNQAADLLGTLGLAAEQLQQLDKLSELVMLTEGMSPLVGLINRAMGYLLQYRAR